MDNLPLEQIINYRTLDFESIHYRVQRILSNGGETDYQTGKTIDKEEAIMKIIKMVRQDAFIKGSEFTTEKIRSLLGIRNL